MLVLSFLKDRFFVSSQGFVDFNGARDTEQVVTLFKDDWTLLLDETLQKTYSVKIYVRK